MATTGETMAQFLPREEIEKRAREVLRRHGLETLPIDPVVLANREGVKVYNAKFSDDNLVGMIAKRGGDVTMLVNQSDPPARKRFTIAHELGHHFLHLHEQDGQFVDGEANLFREPRAHVEEMTPERRQEIQANMFAAALLMPEDLVRQQWPLLRSVEEMAKLFNVSVPAMGFRIDQLGLD
jgi:Zn-dependent peptidase ImmA (M78 family)